MRLIKPIVWADAMLLATPIAEPDTGETAWAAGTAYAVGQRAYRPNHRIYRRLVAGTTATVPESDATNWAIAGTTNKFAMFDAEVSTQTVWPSPLTITIEPGQIDSLTLANAQGDSATITMTSVSGGGAVYGRTVDLSAVAIYDWWTYFFAPFDTAASVTLTDLPPWTDCQLTVTIVSASGTAKCGALIAGSLYEVGGVQYGVSAGSKSYTRKTTDSEGFSTVERRKNSKTLRAKVTVEEGAFNALHALLQEVDGLVCVWLGDDTGVMDPLNVVGFCRDFRLTVDYPSRGYYEFDIEGVI